MKISHIAAVLMLGFAPLGTLAQTSSMTDQQVMEFVVKEHKLGTSQSQIATKLIQRGVDIQQIRRVRKMYDRQIQNQGLGTVVDEAQSNVENRMRKSNDNVRTQQQSTTQRVGKEPSFRNSYGENDPDFMQFQNELGYFISDDSLTEEKSKVKVFGRDIFNNKNLTFEPSMNIATPQNYRLGPGDAVIIDIYGVSQKTIQATVSPDGDVNIPDFGPIQVSGLSIQQANARLRSQLGARYQNSKVRLTLGQTRTITINVMGEVKAPGTYTLSAFASVFHALYMAGGTNDIGTLRNIKVYRNGRQVSQVDIYDYILNGKQSGNIRLADGDVIVVGPYDCLVNITGKVKRPMYYEMKKTESVKTLLSYAGGFAGDAYTKAVRLNRKTGREYSVYNIEEFDMGAFHLADGDSVSVDSVLPRYANTVEVKGAVFRPGMYQLGKSINSVRTLVEHAEGLTEQAFTNRAVMHRMKPDRTLEVVSLDLGGIMSGEVADIPLKENDVLFVPSKQESQINRTITIHGEVLYPGIYEYADNETLEDFVLQAGGLRETASTVKVDVARRISNPKATKTDSIIAQTFTFALKDGFVVDGKPGFTLMPYDEVYVRKSPAYNAQQNITIEGQAMFPGVYTLYNKKERLSEVVRKAGGVNMRAYVPGARLERRYTPEERLRTKTLMKAINTQSGKDSIDVEKLDLGDTYYVGIELDKALAHPGGDADIIMREGDRLIIPEYNATVKISGDVVYPNTVAFQKGKNASWYIDQAGGWGNEAKKSHSIIIYMNGTVAKVSHGAKVMPGCEIVVPSKAKSRGNLAQTLAIATSVASFGTIIATLANILK